MEKFSPNYMKSLSERGTCMEPGYTEGEGYGILLPQISRLLRAPSWWLSYTDSFPQPSHPPAWGKACHMKSPNPEGLSKYIRVLS